MVYYNSQREKGHYMEKVQIQSITVDPFETGTPEFTVDSFKEANANLAHLSMFAPKGGAYNKCDFTITFEDGEEYTGRYDLKHYTEELPALDNHVKSFVGISSGLQKPAWMEQNRFDELIQFEKDHGDQEMWLYLAKNYDVGVEIV